MLSHLFYALVATTLVSAIPLSVGQACDFVECGLALAPTGVSCVSAAAELGGNPFADSSCAVSVAKLGLDAPEACKPCLAQAEAALPEPLKPVAETVGGVKDVINTGLGTVFEGVKDQISGFTSLFGRQDTCDFVECGLALAPTGVSCVSAGAELGGNPFADSGCAISVVKLGLNTPDICKACLAQAEAALPEPLKPVAETVGGLKDVINTGLGTVFEGVKDQFSGLTHLFGREENLT